MKEIKNIKAIAILSIMIVLKSSFSGLTHGRKPKGAPCYTIDEDYEVGKYTGNLWIYYDGSLKIVSGDVVYKVSNLTQFSEQGSYGVYREGRGWWFYEYEGKMYIHSGVYSKELRGYGKWWLGDGELYVREGDGIWRYNLSSGTVNKEGINAEKVERIGNIIYYLEGGNVYGEYIGTKTRWLELRDVEDFSIYEDKVGFKHYVYARDGKIWYGNNIGNVYGLLGLLNVDNNTYERWKSYLDYDQYRELLNESNKYSGYMFKIFRARVNYTEIDPMLPTSKKYNPRSSIEFTFPWAWQNEDGELELRASGFGKVEEVSYKKVFDPTWGVFRLERVVEYGYVHMIVSINGHKVGDYTGAKGVWYTERVKLKSGYLHTGRNHLNGLEISFEVRTGSNTYGYGGGEVEYKSLKAGNMDVFRDRDEDGLGYVWENYYGTNPNNSDTDGDGIIDGTEVYGWSEEINGHKVKVHSNPVKRDSDGDGLSDGLEKSIGTNPELQDSDGDGMPDAWEHKYGLNPKSSSDKNGDKDKDGLTNYEEYKHGTNPDDSDTDDDGMPDGWEVRYGLNPNWSKDAGDDKDGDGLTNVEEYKYGTVPTRKDTDGDGLSDYFEVMEGWNASWYDSKGVSHTKHVNSNPLLADSDGDGLSDFQEYKMGLNPESKDTDGDGLDDGNEKYTRVYEYPNRIYISGGSKTLWLKWKEDPATVKVDSAKVIIGIRGDNGNINMNLYYGNTKLGSKSGSGAYFISEDLTKYVGKSDRWVHAVVSGKGWVEAFKVILVEESNAHKWDTDGDGLSDGYEVSGKSGYITSPVSKDTDGDGISDYWEIKGWSWDYNSEKKYRNDNGFHTNPLSVDTDGDGYNDNEDANPVANLVLRMSLEKYVYGVHPDYTKFAEFYAKWSLDGKSGSVTYYTEHKDHTPNLNGYVYWFDIPDDINTKIYLKAAAFYNDWGDKKLWDGSGSFNIENGYVYWLKGVKGVLTIKRTNNYATHVIKGGTEYDIETKFWVYALHRINTVAVYNGTSFIDGHYTYSGKFYVLYAQSSTAKGAIKKGLNIILVPDAIFVNSKLYDEIKNNKNYLAGSSPQEAKLGAITTKTSGVHIVGMFFFKSDADNLLQLLSLLSKSKGGVNFANYKAITPEQANLPSDVLEAIPYEGMQNSKTGGAPKNLWQQLSGAIGGAITSVADFIYNGLVALGNFIEHAAEVVAQFAMKLWSTGVSVVKKAVEVVKKVVDAVVEWIKEMMAKAIDGFVNLINGLSNNAGTKLGNAAKEMAMDINNNQGEVDTEAVTVDVMKILEVIDGLMTGVLIGISAFAVAELLWYAATEGIGAVVSEIIAGMLKNVVLSLLLTGVAIETMNKVAEKTEHGIDNSVVKGLLNMFSLSSEFAGLIWDIYKLVVEKAENGIYRFYVGLAIAIIGFILSTVGTTLSMSGVILKDYDFLTIAVALGGLSIMYSDRKGDMAGRFLPLTSLLEWSVGWIGVISGFIKLAADAGSHFQG